jgi:hypothetical protein
MPPRRRYAAGRRAAPLRAPPHLSAAAGLATPGPRPAARRASAARPATHRRRPALDQRCRPPTGKRPQARAPRRTAPVHAPRRASAGPARSARGLPGDPPARRQRGRRPAGHRRHGRAGRHRAGCPVPGRPVPAGAAAAPSAPAAILPAARFHPATMAGTLGCRAVGRPHCGGLPTALWRLADRTVAVCRAAPAGHRVAYADDGLPRAVSGVCCA